MAAGKSADKALFHCIFLLKEAKRSDRDDNQPPAMNALSDCFPEKPFSSKLDTEGFPPIFRNVPDTDFPAIPGRGGFPRFSWLTRTAAEKNCFYHTSCVNQEKKSATLFCWKCSVFLEILFCASTAGLAVFPQTLSEYVSTKKNVFLPIIRKCFAANLFPGKCQRNSARPPLSGFPRHRCSGSDLTANFEVFATAPSFCMCQPRKTPCVFSTQFSRQSGGDCRLANEHKKRVPDLSGTH